MIELSIVAVALDVPVVRTRTPVVAPWPINVELRTVRLVREPASRADPVLVASTRQLVKVAVSDPPALTWVPRPRPRIVVRVTFTVCAELFAFPKTAEAGVAIALSVMIVLEFETAWTPAAPPVGT